MVKNLLKNIFNNEHLHHTALNAGAVWSAGTFGNIFSNSVFRFNFNGAYNLTNHGTAGAIAGTIACRLNRIGWGLAAITALIAGFEIFENGYVFKDIRGLTSLDTILDVTAIYAGFALSFLAEKAKEYVNGERVKPKRNYKVSIENLVELDAQEHNSKINRFYETWCKR